MSQTYSKICVSCKGEFQTTYSKKITCSTPCRFERKAQQKREKYHELVYGPKKKNTFLERGAALKS